MPKDESIVMTRNLVLNTEKFNKGETMQKDQKGFSPAGVAVVVIAIGLISIVGWSVWKQRTTTNKTEASNSSVNQTNVEQQPSTKSFKLASDTVSLEVPQLWTREGTGCSKVAPAFENQEYLDSTAIIPGEKLPTKYGNGDEFFTINVCVFGNKKKLSAYDWYEDASVGGIGEGIPSGEDKSSKDPISSHGAYYHKRINTEYEEVNYVLSAEEKIVYIKARIYEPGTSPDGKAVGDFRKFESSIEQIVKSVDIK